MSTNLSAGFFYLVNPHSDISFNNFSWTSSCQEKRYEHEFLVDRIIQKLLMLKFHFSLSAESVILTHTGAHI